MTSPLAVPGVSYVRANWSRWVADCVSPMCRSALQVHVGETDMTCGDCGRWAPLSWPPDPLAIETLLGMRPDIRARNWEPGEDLPALLADNAAHGCFPPTWLQTGGTLMDVADGRVTGGLMLDMLPAARRAEIGV